MNEQNPSDSELTRRAREVLASLPVDPRERAIAIVTDERLCTRWRSTMVAFKRGCRPLRVGSESYNELTDLGRAVHVLAFPDGHVARMLSGVSGG